jgi:hypothetical protein
MLSNYVNKITKYFAQIRKPSRVFFPLQISVSFLQGIGFEICAPDSVGSG